MVVSFELAPASVKVPPGSRKRMEVIGSRASGNPATVDGHSENNLHIRRITCGIGGIEAEARAPTTTANIVVKKR